MQDKELHMTRNVFCILVVLYVTYFQRVDGFNCSSFSYDSYNITNGYIVRFNGSDYFNRTTITYGCNPGYGTRDPLLATCSNSTSSWLPNPNLPECIRSCPPFNYNSYSVTNGYIKRSNLSVFFAGETITYECNAGYGTRVRTRDFAFCDYFSLRWRYKFERCHKECSNLESALNDTLWYDSSSNKLNLDGDMVSLYCKDWRSNLFRNGYASCYFNGSWNIELREECKISSCGLPNPIKIQNGFLNLLYSNHTYFVKNEWLGLPTAILNVFDRFGTTYQELNLTLNDLIILPTNISKEILEKLYESFDSDSSADFEGSSSGSSGDYQDEILQNTLRYDDFFKILIPSFPPGTTLPYACDDGYYTNDPIYTTCNNETLTWTLDNNPPRCYKTNSCSDLNCSSNAVCIVNENRTSTCECISGFRGDPYRLCQPYCKSEHLEINQVSYKFLDTWDNQFAYSIETCQGTSRSIASVFCKNSKFEVSDAVVVPCNISVTSIKVDNSLKTISEAELQNLTSVLRLVISSEDRTLNENQSDFLVSVLRSALTNDVKVNPTSFSNAMVILSDVLYNANNDSERNLTVVKLIEEFSSRVVLPNGTNSIEIETDELVAKVYKVEFKFANDTSANQNQSISDNVILRDTQTNNTEVAVEFDLPISAFSKENNGNSKAQNNQQFFTTYYKVSSLFPSKFNVTSVFSISLVSNVSTTQLQNPLKIRFSNQDYKVGKAELPSNHLLVEQTKLECRFWNFSTNQWSREGCCLNQSQFPPVCQCNHLTNFALLVAIDKVPNDVILNYISDVGCVLSIIGLVITITLHLLITERRKIQTTKVFLNVCFNLMVAYIIFVSGIDQASNKNLCSAIAILLHYFFLTSWFWMTAYCFDLYLNLIKVTHSISSSAVMKGSYIFGYFLPLIIVGLTSIITLGHLDKSDSGYTCDEENILATSFYRADNMCWLHGYSLYIGFLLPVGILLIINISIYALVLKKVICKKKKIGNVSTKMSQKRILTISLTLFSTMGISWIVGFFMLVSTDPDYSIALSWVFAIVTASQGLLIFLTSCILQTYVRNEMRKWMGNIRNVVGRKSDTNSTSVQTTSSKNV